MLVMRRYSFEQWVSDLVFMAISFVRVAQRQVKCCIEQCGFMSLNVTLAVSNEATDLDVLAAGRV